MGESAKLIESIMSHADVKQLPADQLPRLAEEIRTKILETVCHTGGHLASSLGSVDLSIALMRVFSPPEDQIVWDVGHQTYPWKLLTGRFDRFSTLRQLDGLSGFPKPEESPCDASVSGHAGVALSTAVGMAVARDRLGLNREIVAVVGDGAMTNGISLEGLNSLEDANSKVIIILNDNEMSISENVGAFSRYLGRMLTNVKYNRLKTAAESAGHRLHMTFLRRYYHQLESKLKSFWLKNTFFEEFGIRYIGPIDGHNFEALENAFNSAKEYRHTVLIHVATQKGKGYAPAEEHPHLWHGVGPFNLETGGQKHSTNGYSHVFGRSLCQIAELDPKVVAITAAMRDGTGLTDFSGRFPDRFFDVGICEEHAVVFAAGLAHMGMKPVLAVYSTFLQRAVDCVMHDVCLSNLPVVFCLDRAGVVGSDGPTHHGMFDIPMLRCLPNLSIMQPRNADEVYAMLQCAFRHHGPCVIRYPRGAAPLSGRAKDDPIPPVLYGRAEVVEPAIPDGTKAIWIWVLGDFVQAACEVAEGLRKSGENAGVVNARFVKPLDVDLLCPQARRAKYIVTMENGSLAGGFGSAVREALANSSCPVKSFGWPDTFIPQGTPKELRERYGLTPKQMLQELQLTS